MVIWPGSSRQVTGGASGIGEAARTGWLRAEASVLVA